MLHSIVLGQEKTTFASGNALEQSIKLTLQIMNLM